MLQPKIPKSSNQHSRQPSSLLQNQGPPQPTSWRRLFAQRQMMRSSEQAIPNHTSVRINNGEPSESPQTGVIPQFRPSFNPYDRLGRSMESPLVEPRGIAKQLPGAISPNIPGIHKLLSRDPLRFGFRDYQVSPAISREVSFPGIQPIKKLEVGANPHLRRMQLKLCLRNAVVPAQGLNPTKQPDNFRNPLCTYRPSNHDSSLLHCSFGQQDEAFISDAEDPLELTFRSPMPGEITHLNQEQTALIDLRDTSYLPILTEIDVSSTVNHLDRISPASPSWKEKGCSPERIRPRERSPGETVFPSPSAAKQHRLTPNRPRSCNPSRPARVPDFPSLLGPLQFLVKCKDNVKVPILYLAYEVFSDNFDRFSCSICFDYCPFPEDTCQLQCLHRFHLRCVTNWLRSKPHCPICRTKTTEIISVEP